MSVKTAPNGTVATVENEPTNKASITLGMIVGYPSTDGASQLRMTTGGDAGTVLQIQGGPAITLSDESVAALRRDLGKALK